MNDPKQDPPLFTTGVIGKDNAIARHGIHGLYWLFSIDVPGLLLEKSVNIIFLTQTMASGPLALFQGIMYDYIRLEGPNPFPHQKIHLIWLFNMNMKKPTTLFAFSYLSSPCLSVFYI